MTLGSRVLTNDMQYVVEHYGNLEVFEDKTILITSFAGFLGYYVTHFFLNALDRSEGKIPMERPS